MAKFGAWTNGFIKVNGVDLSPQCEMFDLGETTQALPFDAHGDTTAIETPGLKKHQVSARFYGDFAALKVNATLRPLYDNQSIFPVQMQPASGAISPTNPQWSGNFFISKFDPMKGKHGDTLMTEVTFSPSTPLTELEA